jgi:hypothetical protein
MDMADAQKLRDSAERCTRLAHSISDERIRSALIAVAAESSATARLVDRQRWMQSRQPASSEPTQPTSNPPDQPVVAGLSDGGLAQPDAIVVSEPTDGVKQPAFSEPTQPTSKSLEQPVASGISNGGLVKPDANVVSQPTDGVQTAGIS